jgi:hypothetical protein
MDAYIAKGSRITAQWYDAANKPIGSWSLAGVSVKALAAQCVIVAGTVRHIYGAGNFDPRAVFYIDPDGDCDLPRVTDCSCGKPHVAVKAQHVTGVLP